jgi:hypothetical protein
MPNGEEGVFETDKSHFEIFQKEASYWLNKYGLIGWEIHFAHEENEDARASCTTWGSGRICALTLATKWEGIIPTPKAIAFVAYHEVCELLLADLVETATDRKFDPENVVAKTHAIIRTLENVHWNGDERAALYEKKITKKKK